MKIKKRLWFNTIISIGTVLLILFSIAWFFREIIIADRNMKLVDEMRKVAFDRILLRDEYLLYQEKRSETQWYAKTDKLRELIKLADKGFDHGEDKALLEDVRKDFEDTAVRFSGVMHGHVIQAANADTKPVFSDAEAQLISQVFLKAYSLTDNINRLHESAQKTTTKARNKGASIVVIIILTGIILLIINSAIIRTTLADRITALHKGVEILGAGDLDYRILAEGDDELTDLAQANNEMAAKLRQSYTSVANLEKEIAERIRAEDTLKRYTVELKRSNEELQQFAYIASHDLQEPLRMISSYLQLIERRYKGKLDKDADEFIGFAVDGASRLQGMIIGLLAYSRVGTKGKPFEEVNTSEVLAKAIVNLQLAIKESGALVKIDALPVVMADENQLVSLFQNLISNAIKFKRNELPLIYVSAEKKDKEWLFSVKDNSIGIAPEYKERIFKIFQRLHGIEYPGVGIGLSICRRIVERHGGLIWFESEIGKGTTFYFTIPIKT